MPSVPSTGLNVPARIESWIFFLLGARDQVGRVHAQRRVAAMAKDLGSSELPASVLKREPMGQRLAHADAVLAVSGIQDGASPAPAVVRASHADL
jgi:hypothetical protein